MKKWKDRVFEIRPPKQQLHSVFRYADGKWIPDDGEWDLAFIGNDKGCPMCWSVDMPYYDNIQWSFLTTHWGAYVKEHQSRRQNAWHYMLFEPDLGWGNPWNRDRHPNRIAGDKGSNEQCSRSRCSNGRGPQFHPNDYFIVNELLRDRDTKEVVAPSDTLICMDCGPIKLADIRGAK